MCSDVNYRHILKRKQQRMLRFQMNEAKTHARTYESESFFPYTPRVVDRILIRSIRFYSFFGDINEDSADLRLCSVVVTLQVCPVNPLECQNDENDEENRNEILKNVKSQVRTSRNHNDHSR